MERVCFVLEVKEGLLDEYVAAHDDVWPEMIAAMRDVGITNYSMFYRPDGLVIGYLEVDNPQDAFARLEQTDVSVRWESEMAKYFKSGTGEFSSSRDEGLQWLQQFFFIE